MKKKIFLISGILLFANCNFALAAYFYADAVETAIQNFFPSDLQFNVAAEYEAQMDSAGNISTAGLEQVCYAGGFDVSTESGAESCNNFVNEMSNSCVYATGSGLTYYTNPTTAEEKVKKCVFDKAIDYVFEWENGFQRDPNDAGNKICDANMKPLKDANGKDLLGATNMGITTCASGLSVYCVQKMTEKDARHYYWTRFYRKYGYYKLPASAIAAVMELAVGGTGTVANELRGAANVTGCGTSPVVNDCTAEAVSNFINKNGVDAFYKNIATLRANKRTGKQRERALGIQKLSTAYKTCGG